jgi:hypothetical protein
VNGRQFAEAVIASFPAPNAATGLDGVFAVFTPENPDACRVTVAYQAEYELVQLFLGPDDVPVELSLTGPVVLADVRPWLEPRLAAVFAGRYEQEWATLRDGSFVSVVGTFHLDDRDVRHVVRARLGWFRRKRRRRVTFASYE